MNPLLGRWISADPLAVHAPGEADLNVYAYVRGWVLKSIDPVGLENTGGAPNGTSTPIEREPVGGAEGASGVDETRSQRVEFMVAPGAADGSGHAALLVEGSDGIVYYMSQHPNSDLSTLQKVHQGVNPAAGVDGSLHVKPLGIEDDINMVSRPVTMDEARADAQEGYVANVDTYYYTGYHYSDSVTVHASASGADAMMSEASSMQEAYQDGTLEYNLCYNNCADAAQDITNASGELQMPEEAWGVDGQTPNAYYEEAAAANGSTNQSSGDTEAASGAVSEAIGTDE